MPAASVAALDHGARPVASIQELMQLIVDPSADAIWESVSSDTSAEGTVDRQPRSDADWQVIRHHALLLAEGANLLQLESRPVAHHGRTLEDAHVDGVLSPDQVQQKVAADPRAFHAHAQTLQAAAEQTLAAVDRRSIDGLLEAGYRLDRACEGCHLVYWYPGDKRPPAAVSSAPSP
ncbi:MAG: hypothetical protein C0434_07215 [Xanthomonadaceae bacterium]|nr:hypothetical protein [Xanthomonadaceae bacterium]